MAFVEKSDRNTILAEYANSEERQLKETHNMGWEKEV